MNNCLGRPRSVWAACLPFVLCLSLPAAAQVPNGAAPLPMWEEPSHQPVFSRDHVRVMDVFFPGGATSEYHFHENAATYVFVEPGRVADQTYGEAWVKAPEGMLQTGLILMRTDYLAKNLFHRVRNIDTQPTRIFAVVNLSDKDANPLDAQTEMQDGRIDNAWFRVRRLELDAGARSAALALGDDAILMQTTDSLTHVETSGAAGDYKSLAGAFSYHPAGAQITVVNESAGSASLVLIEVKD